MPDREKTIQHLEMVKEEIRTSKYDTWFSGTKKVRFMGYVDDAIELLKEQEPIQMKVSEDYGSIKFGDCPKCKAFINNRNYPKSCGCGQKVKWDD